MFAVRRAGGH